VTSALVAVSGDLAFSAAPPGRNGWRVGMLAVPAADAPVPAVIELTHAAVSTSGNREQYLEVDGRRCSHVVDPAASSGLVADITVTVIAAHGLLADGLGTAASVLGAERGLALLERHTTAAGLIVTRTGDDRRLLMSSRLREIVDAQPGA